MNALTLAQCLHLALLASPSVRTAELRVEQARRHVVQSQAAFGPTATLAASDIAAGYDNAGRLIRKPRYDQDTHAYTFNAGWNLFNDGRDWRTYKQSRLDLESSRADQERSREDLVAATVQAYFNELLSLRLADVRRRFGDSRKEYLDITEKLYKAGVRSYTDLLDARLQYRQEQLNVLNAESAERSARAAVNVLLDRPLSDSLSLSDVTSVPAPPRDLEEDERAAELARPEMRQARLAVDRAGIGASGALAELFPALTVEASYNYRFDEPTVSLAPGVSFSVTNPYWQVGAKLSYPIFDSGLRWQQWKLSKLALEVAKDDLENQRRLLASQVLNAHLGIDQNREAWSMSKEELATAREQLRIVLDRYRDGTVSALVVKDAQTSLVNFEVSEAQALYGAHLAREQLLKAMGTLTAEAFQ